MLQGRVLIVDDNAVADVRSGRPVYANAEHNLPYL